MRVRAFFGTNATDEPITAGLLVICPGSSFRPQFRISRSRSRSVGCRASKENEILIWIRDYKGSGTPWLLLEWLMEGDF